MKFISNQNIKVRIGDTHNCYWKTIRTGETIDLTMETGKQLGLTELKPKLTEGQIGNKKVETKQIDTVNDTVNDADDFLKELINIKGIGKETAEDIIRIFPKSEDLKNKIHKMETLPFRENICIALNKRYSK